MVGKTEADINQVRWEVHLSEADTGKFLDEIKKKRIKSLELVSDNVRWAERCILEEENRLNRSIFTITYINCLELSGIEQRIKCFRNLAYEYNVSSDKRYKVLEAKCREIHEYLLLNTKYKRSNE